MELSTKVHVLIPPNKMELLNARIDISLRLLELCYLVPTCPKCSEVMLFWYLPISLIGCLVKFFPLKHPLKNSNKIFPLFTLVQIFLSEYLAVRPLYMFIFLTATNLTLELLNMLSLVFFHLKRATNAMTHLHKSYFLALIWLSLSILLTSRTPHFRGRTREKKFDFWKIWFFPRHWTWPPYSKYWASANYRREPKLKGKYGGT